MTSVTSQSLFSSQEFKERIKKKEKPDNKTYGRIPFIENGFPKRVTMFVAPLSVNNAWKGRRFKTKSYQNYQEALLRSLPPYIIPEGLLQIGYVFGFSSTLSDFDNPVKTTTDCLSKRYGFNDNLIRKAMIEVKIVPKGQEYFKFKIEQYVERQH